MKILFHICCAPCAVYPFRKLKEEFEEVMGFWYNPNIHPFLEYQKRLEAVKIWAEREGVTRCAWRRQLYLPEGENLITSAPPCSSPLIRINSYSNR